MSYTVDSISIRGLRKAHLRQLVSYIYARDHHGEYYGPKKQFDDRHSDLLEWADQVEAIVNDPDARILRARRSHR